ncbi:MAG: hypothetical protein LBJ60_00260 [Tannerellaceae bacterium]|jgi:hypothetical protein|nr:hypothetical protein [Tannerellaceae bacterium]
MKINRTKKRLQQSFYPCKKRLIHLQILHAPFCFLLSAFSLFNFQLSIFNLIGPGFPLQSLARRAPFGVAQRLGRRPSPSVLEERRPLLEECRPLLEERRPLLEERRPLLEKRFPSLAGRKPGRLFYIPFVHAKRSLLDFLPGIRKKRTNRLKE